MDTLSYDSMFNLMLRMDPKSLKEFASVNDMSRDVYNDTYFWRKYGADVFTYDVTYPRDESPEYAEEALNYLEFHPLESYIFDNGEKFVDTIHDSINRRVIDRLKANVTYSYPIKIFHIIYEGSLNASNDPYYQSYGQIYVILIIDYNTPTTHIEYEEDEFNQDIEGSEHTIDELIEINPPLVYMRTWLANEMTGISYIEGYDVEYK